MSYDKSFRWFIERITDDDAAICVELMWILTYNHNFYANIDTDLLRFSDSRKFSVKLKWQIDGAEEKRKTKHVSDEINILFPLI